MDNRANNKRIVKNTIFLYFRMCVVLLVQLYISRRLLEALGVDDYGTYNLIAGLVTMFTFFSSSLSNGYQRFFNYSRGAEHQSLSIYFSSSIIIQVSATVIVILILETFGLWFLNNKLNIPPNSMGAAQIVYQGVIVALFANMIRVPYQALVVAFERLNLYAVLSIFEISLNLIIVLLLKCTENNALALYGILYPISIIFTTLIYIVYCRKRIPQVKYSFNINKPIIKEITTFSGWNLIGSLAHMLKNQGVSIVLNIFFGVVINASRGIASQIQAGLSNLYQNFQMASRPQTIQSYASGDVARAVNLSNSVSRLSFLLLWLFSLPVILNIDFILQIWLGSNIPQFTALFSILSISIALIESFSAPIATLAHATGKIRNFQLCCSIFILLIVPAAYLVLKLGAPPEGALYTSIVLLTLTQIVRLIIIKTLLPFSIISYLKVVMLPAVSVVLISLTISSLCTRIIVFNHQSFLYLFLVLVINLISIYFFGLHKTERSNVIKMVHAKLSTMISH